MGTHSQSTFTSIFLLLVHYTAIGLSQEPFSYGSTVCSRIVLRGVTVLDAKGHRLSEPGLPLAIKSFQGKFAHPRSSVIFDCDYHVLPDIANDSSIVKNVNSTETKGTSSSHKNLTSMANNDTNSTRMKHEGLRRFELQPPVVVKWFRNGEGVPFYQWIPEIGSQLFHHAYWGYKHNNRPMEMFRAIRVTRPVRELSGNFTCNVVENKKEDSPAGEYLEQIASHEILVYDPPSDFEIRLNMSSRELQCAALVTGEDSTSVTMAIFRQDHDRWDSELGERLRLNSTMHTSGESPGHDNYNFNKPDTTRPFFERAPFLIEKSVSLRAGDLKVLEMGISRTFICEIVFSRLRGAIEDRSDLQKHDGSPANPTFQRSIRIYHESPLSDDGNDYVDLSELLESALWSGLDSSAPNFRLTLSSALFLSIHNLLV
ncbi:uncharacterized protein LOC111270484 isoform X2 [Varroa jacobsoni]|uniref:Ig-like domain-containing protein n=1 Tax=Varroa destructor TaxID=109461 RepID=A0A7M7JMY2_VARDE|nr:uncharacterized protein LOC111245546 isoform X2 [Varroa destructor]XP_022706463.1 uncharacterized protein LOC111270484 isoform X2 [Varroa jacobsoni]